MPDTDYGSLKTLEGPDGTVPKSRVQDALSCQSRLRLYIDADWALRGLKRAHVQGLVDGNPPYSSSALARSAKRDRCNVNWRTPSSYVDSAQGIFYDLATEAPTELTIWLDPPDKAKPGQEMKKGEWTPTPDEISDWQSVMGEEGHEVLNNDNRWDWLRQCSQRQMVIHGCGPMLFEDRFSVIPRFVTAGSLKVDENAESNPYYWQACFVLVDYTPDQLYDFISNEKSAATAGWNVEYTKNVLINALPKSNTAGVTWDWEYWQQRFKQNSWASYPGEKVIPVAYAFWKEFDGKVSLGIIEQAIQGTPGSDSHSAYDWMFIHVGRYDSWSQVIHPMYYSAGNGPHYTVEGLGVKMYSAMTYENRLRCKLADEAMAPKILFKPTSEASTSFNLVPISDYAKMSAGWDMVQIAMQGQLNDGMVMLNELGRLSANNLQQYRQTWNRPEGNPPTARQVQVEQQQQYAVQGTQISHYYKQLDMLFTEIVRRLCLDATPDPIAKEFQERCKKRGVPDEAFSHVRKVEANRVAGQGSASLRQQALDRLMAVLPRLPESGQDAVLSDWIAAYTGQRSVRRYYPELKQNNMGSEQDVEASLQVAGMRTGEKPEIAPEQNPVVFASRFLLAAMGEIQKLQQGANPMAVLQFLELAGPAAAQHLSRFSNDQTRTGIYKKLNVMLKQVAGATDKLMAQVQKMAMQQAQQRGRNGGGLPPEVQQKLAIEDAKGRLKLQQMALSHRQRLQQRAEQHRMELESGAARTQADIAAKDATTAAEIGRGSLKAFSTEDNG